MALKSMQSPTFVVGTGRCGSTMLSNMLREHPSILSLSEFFCFAVDFGGRISQAFTRELIDGEAFWKIVGAVAPRSNMLVQNDIAPSEFLYPYKSGRSRFSSETGVPLILHITLPHITEQYDELFDEIHEYVNTRPVATVREHYIELFTWLQNRFNKSLWIERSGGMLVLIEQIFATFPDARFIHIVRDGRNSALSMSKHHGFRIYFLAEILTEILGVDPYELPDRSNLEKVPLELQNFLPENFDRQAFFAHRFPLSLCGQLWSQQIVNGLSFLNKLPEDRLLTIVYENLLEDPQTSLENLTEFLGKEFIAPAWIKKASATVRQPRSSWQDLSGVDQAELDKACQPGFEALRDSGVKCKHWEYAIV